MTRIWTPIACSGCDSKRNKSKLHLIEVSIVELSVHNYCELWRLYMGKFHSISTHLVTTYLSINQVIIEKNPKTLKAVQNAGLPFSLLSAVFLEEVFVHVSWSLILSSSDTPTLLQFITNWGGDCGVNFGKCCKVLAIIQ